MALILKLWPSVLSINLISISDSSLERPRQCSAVLLSRSRDCWAAEVTADVFPRLPNHRDSNGEIGTSYLLPFSTMGSKIF